VDSPARAIARRVGETAASTEVDDGPGGISEVEMTKLITEEAQREHPGLSSAAAFTKLFVENSERGIIFRKAIAACRGFATQPASKQAVSTSGTSYDQLMVKANELQKREPHLSREQSFAKAYQQNPELARAERAANRPA
jgi:hypothetical protein